MRIRLFWLIIILILSPTFTFAQGDGSCITAKCHEDMGTKEFVHGPVGARICTVCHTVQEGKQHKFNLSAEKDELCFGCHEASRDMVLEDHVHTPVADGNCVGCHDPHQSDFKYTLKGNASDLCFQCHKKELVNKEFVHGPIGAGDCNACHSPHASANEDQLVSPKDQLCFNCHKEMQDKMNKRHKHAPVAESCTNCHDPHSDVAKFLLPNNPPELCYECHEGISERTHLAYQHQPVVEGKCNACHDPHASDEPRLFPQPQVDLCLSCHGEMKELVDNQEFKHGPVKEGDCNACHDPHGSEFVTNLRKYFPPEFYKPYETENYDICFGCHNKDIALHEKTTSLTDFRDGDLNLHFLHVNKDTKGRSCKACHQVHASSQSKHIRESVPFGKINWDLPVTFTKFADGGKCVVGCHAPKEYHRE